MEGDLIKISNWLLPLSWLYGLGVSIRNNMFELGILKSHSFDIPIISIGNITVGGTGKTPHVEYLVRLLSDNFKVAVLSRGYKRRSRGFILAEENTRVDQIGDEPYQMHRKFKNIFVAVDKNRCHGIAQLTNNSVAENTDVILLDDAYQHRYVMPGINILLVDYHRLIIYDKLLPAGRLREPQSGKNRANIVIITKCPKDIKPMDIRVLIKAMSLYPYQQLYFSTLKYGNMHAIFGEEEKALSSIRKDDHILLLTGIASPQQMLADLRPYCDNIKPLNYGDHHAFTAKDCERINAQFASMPSPKLMITTEKDESRILNTKGLSEEVKKNIFTLPIEVEFLQDENTVFNKNIIGYVRKNSRNSILAKKKDDNESANSNHPGNRTGTISFRDS